MRTSAKLLLGVVMAALWVGPSVAQSGESCAAIGDDAERLACYDGVFRGSGPTVPVDGIVLESEQLIPARPSGRAPATLSFACVEQAPEVRFSFAGQAVSATGDIAPVTLQIDQGPTQVRTMQASDDNQSLLFGSVRETTAFLDSLNGGTTIKVRMTPVRQRSLNVNFRLTEIADEIRALRDSCRVPS